MNFKGVRGRQKAESFSRIIHGEECGIIECTVPDIFSDAEEDMHGSTYYPLWLL